MTSVRVPLRSALTAPVRVVLPRLARFSAFCLVGGLAFGVDLAVYNLLRMTVLEERPILAKVASVAVAMVVAWLGNRHLTFRDADKASSGRELALFVAANGIGLGIAAVCLFVSHYLLGLTSALADNLSGNGAGLVLGTTFRWAAYRRLVFRR